MDEQCIEMIAAGNAKRLDVYLSENQETFSRSFLKNIIKKNKVLVNGSPAKTKQKIVAGDKISVYIEASHAIEAQPENIPIDIVYEDSELAVINKKQGMVVHPAAGNQQGTLVNAILYSIKDLSGINGAIRPGIVHRLDKDTSGLLVVAKNDSSHNYLSEQIKLKKAKRIYHALVYGNIKQDRGIIDAPIGRHKTDRKKMAVTKNGRTAVTIFQVLERFGEYTYVECELTTGRTHQIRVHMKHIGHPVVGDEKYCTINDKFNLKGQLLHACKLGFFHPGTVEYMEFYAPLPDYFEKTLNLLRSVKPMNSYE